MILHNDYARVDRGGSVLCRDRSTIQLTSIIFTASSVIASNLIEDR